MKLLRLNQIHGQARRRRVRYDCQVKGATVHYHQPVAQSCDLFRMLLWTHQQPRSRDGSTILFVVTDCLIVMAEYYDHMSLNVVRPGTWY